MEHNARNEAKHTEPVQKASETAAKKTRQSGQRLTPAQREEQILQVAAAHFAQHGVVAACMSSIAQRPVLLGHCCTITSPAKSLWRRR